MPLSDIGLDVMELEQTLETETDLPPLKQQRDRKIVGLFKNGGKGVKDLAEIFGISQRTVQRALKNCRTP